MRTMTLLLAAMALGAVGAKTVDVTGEGVNSGRGTPPIAVTAGTLQNAAQTSLGATATFSGAPNNRDWPANNAIPEETAKGGPKGCLFGAPMAGGTIHIRLITPCTIERIDLKQLDYNGTMCPKTVEISVDGKVVKSIALELKPGQFQEVPVSAMRGSVVSVKCVDTFPPNKLKNGKTGPNWGGWARVRVMVREDVAALIAPPEEYKTVLKPTALQPTGTAAATGTKVYGRPRLSKGHPRTIWDKEDAADYRALLKTNAEFRRQADLLKAALDQRLTQPTGVPAPIKGPDGAWQHLGAKYEGLHNNLAIDVANLGTAYQLFGEEKYAAYAKKILLDYARAFPHYGVGARPGFQHDPSILFDQRLGDATALILFATGYDFVREAKCFTEEDLKDIDENFILADARWIRQNRAHLIGATNWSAIGTAACLAAGVACDNADMINTALWGYRWSSLPEAKRDAKKFDKWWEGDSCEKPNGIELHFSAKSIDVDGMWCEGAMGYQFMALQALVFDAETLWHMGIDLYRYRNCALKGLFDSPILFAYPNLISPAIHDSGNADIVGREAHLYEAGWKRYRDPAYLPILKRISRRLAASFQQFSTSVAWDIDFAGATVADHPSVNLNGVGYGVLRVTDERGERNLLLDYGPNRSHGHPDKLNLDLWAFGKLQVRDPGTVWYENPIYRNWYRTTFAHNTLNVDMQEQNACGAVLLTFAAGDGIGMMRGRTSDAYPGVIMDRSLVLTRDYVADLFGAFSRMPRTFDLAWHPSGECTAKPAGMKPFELPGDRSKGYSELKEMQSVTSSNELRVGYENDGKPYALVLARSAAKEPTTLVIGKAQVSMNPKIGPETPVFERRNVASTIFGNVFDLSGEGKIKSVEQRGSVKEGFAAFGILLADGALDVVFASFKDGEHRVGVFHSNAQQAFVSTDANGGLKAIALAGGTYVEAGKVFSLRLQTEGGAIVEKTETGSFLFRNASSVENTITAVTEKGTKSFTLKPAETAEWLVGGAKPIAQQRQEVLKKLAEAAAAAEAKAKAEKAARVQARKEAAAKAPGAKGTRIVIEAEDFVGEAGGAVRVTDRKVGAKGTSFSHWDSEGQSVDWKVKLPAEGYYNVSLRYCTDTQRHRAIVVNGAAVADSEACTIPSSGGFSNGADNWKTFTFTEADGTPLAVKFEAGENSLRLVNVGGGGVNMDQLYITSPDARP